MKRNNYLVNTLGFLEKTFLTASLMFVTVLSINATENFSKFEPMDVFDLEWASDPRVSPDGKTVVYVRKSNDIMKDRERSNLWQVSVDGTNHRPLYSGLNNIRSPRWSPNGEKLAFLSNAHEFVAIQFHWK